MAEEEDGEPKYKFIASTGEELKMSRGYTG